MEGEIESEPLALKNLPAIVNGQLVRVSVLYSRKYSCGKITKSWEDNGDCSPLHATTKGLLVRVSLRFQEVDVDKSCETSAVALKSTKKWNFLRGRKNLEDTPRTLRTTSISPLGAQLHQQLSWILHLLLHRLILQHVIPRERYQRLT